MARPRPAPRELQQQRARDHDSQQQRFQAQGGQPPVSRMDGEGGSAAAGDDPRRIRNHLEDADVQAGGGAGAGGPKPGGKLREIRPAGRDARPLPEDGR